MKCQKALFYNSVEFDNINMQEFFYYFSLNKKNTCN